LGYFQIIGGLLRVGGGQIIILESLMPEMPASWEEISDFTYKMHKLDVKYV